jgi:hypothetical protein
MKKSQKQLMEEAAAEKYANRLCTPKNLWVLAKRKTKVPCRPPVHRRCSLVY